jgi:predicted nucleic-acid-binding Zn-ribbon protein
MATNRKCLNCGSGNLTANKLGIALRDQMVARPQTEFAVIALVCDECGFVTLFGEKQFSATHN